MPPPKACDKIQHSSMIKTLRKIKIDGNFLNLERSIYKTPTANIIVNSERLNAFSLRLWIMQECSFSNSYSTIVPEVLASATRQEK